MKGGRTEHRDTREGDLLVFGVDVCDQDWEGVPGVPGWCWGCGELWPCRTELQRRIDAVTAQLEKANAALIYHVNRLSEAHARLEMMASEKGRDT